MSDTVKLDLSDTAQRKTISAKWAAMGTTARRALVHRAQYTVGETVCVYDSLALGLETGSRRLAWLILNRPPEGWEWEKC